MIRTRRVLGAALAAMATAAVLSFAGQVAAAEPDGGPAGLVPERSAAAVASADPDEPGRGRGRGGYGYGQEVPSPPSGVQPSVAPPPVDVPPGGLPPSGVSPAGGPPPAELPVTGVPMVAVAVIGGLVVVAGVAIRLIARRRRIFFR